MSRQLGRAAFYPPLSSWNAEPYRAQRIHDLLRGKTRLTPDDFVRIQSDTLSLHATTMLPVLLAHAHPDSGPQQQAVTLLQQWRGNATADSAAAAIFSAWFHQLAPVLAEDDLGPPLARRYAERFSFVTRFAVKTLSANDSAWCDDRASGARETCDDAVTKALRNAVADLTERLGSDISRWRWDGVHHAVFPHQGLDAVRMLRPLLSRSCRRRRLATVNVAPVAAPARTCRRLCPLPRIMTLTANDSRFLDAAASGHFFRALRHSFRIGRRSPKKMRMEQRPRERRDWPLR